MKHRGLFELLEAEGRELLQSKLQTSEGDGSSDREDSATASTRIAIETMLEELAPNLWEDELDRLVDFGHLISPKLEMVNGFHCTEHVFNALSYLETLKCIYFLPIVCCVTTQTVLPALLHGEAVNIDMSFMVYMAHQRGLLTAHEKNRIIQCMLGLSLPVWHQGCTLDLVQRSLVERRSHSAGSLRMPLPTGLGCAGIPRISLSVPECHTSYSISISYHLNLLHNNDWYIFSIIPLYFTEIFHDAIDNNILCQVHQNWTDELRSAGNKGVCNLFK